MTLDDLQVLGTLGAGAYGKVKLVSFKLLQAYLLSIDLLTDRVMLRSNRFTTVECFIQVQHSIPDVQLKTLAIKCLRKPQTQREIDHIKMEKNVMLTATKSQFTTR